MQDYTGLSFQHISYFIEIAERGSMSKAAKRLHVSPSLLSQKIAQLEALIGIKLFHRARQRLSLTDAGRQLLIDFKDIQSQTFHVLDSIREKHSEQRPLTIGFTNYQGVTVDYIVKEFRRECPDTEFAVDVLPRKQLHMDFMDRKIDIIAITDFDRLRQEKAVVTRVALMVQVGCYVNPASALAQKEKLTWKDLDGVTCILPDHSRNSAITKDIQRKLSEENVSVNFQFHSGDIMTVNQLVLLNDCITFAGFAGLISEPKLKVCVMPGLEYPFLVAYHLDASEDVIGHAEKLLGIVNLWNQFKT